MEETQGKLVSLGGAVEKEELKLKRREKTVGLRMVPCIPLIPVNFLRSKSVSKSDRPTSDAPSGFFSVGVANT